MIRKVVIITVVAFQVLSACSPTSKEEKLVNAGRQLSNTYCQGCHQLPAPNQLPKSIWKEILPLMGAKMGMVTSNEEIIHRQILDQTDNRFGERTLVLPQGTLTLEEWLTIKNYYITQSPDSFNIEPTAIEGQSDIFKPKPVTVKGIQPAASLAKFGERHLYYGDAVVNRLYKLDFNKEVVDTFQLDGAPSHLFNEQFVLTMGNIHPNDQKGGKVYRIPQLDIVLDKLQRPVHASYVDLNNDSREDIIVSNFGYLKGKLSVQLSENDGYKEVILKGLPGALKTEILDLNNDGNLDILALMAQSKEGLFLFTGDGKGNFEEKQLIEFPPSYGSSYFELADFNNDGLQDILYVNGDNGDYSIPVHKPYQGIRIFLNQGNLSFEDYYHFHMNGPFKAMTEDYDLDGDLDIFAISYFPDYDRTPDEGLLYLENKGGLQFEANSIGGAIKGKWLVADRADYDNDGDIDILVGNNQIMSLSVPEDLRVEWKKDPLNLLILENTSK